MKYFHFFSTSLLLVISLGLNAQNHYNIRLEAIGNATNGMLCYGVQLASADGKDFNLAGQNYRLYYDTQNLQFNEAQSRTLLPTEKYTDAVIKDNLANIDASGAGLLDFDTHLGFLNLGNDLKDEQNGGIILPASGAWISTTNLCFEVLQANNENINAADYNIRWAREALTKSYASAYVEIAEWTAPFETIQAEAAIYFDKALSTSLTERIAGHQPEIYPNPTNDLLNINFGGKESLKIQVYNMQGQLLLQDNYPANTANYQIKLGALATGIYQLRLSNQKDFIVKKIERL